MNPYKVSIAIVFAITIMGCSITVLAASPTEADEHIQLDGLFLLSADNSSDFANSILSSQECVETDYSMMSEKYDTVIIDSSWVEKRGLDATNVIVDDGMRKGSIVVSPLKDVFVNETSPVSMSAFAYEADLFALFYDMENNRYVCSSFAGSSLTLSTTMLEKWINEFTHHPKYDTVHNSIETIDASSYSNWGTELVSSVYKECEGYGWMNVNTCYFPLNEDNSDYNYYYTRYHVQTVPDTSSGSRTADIRMSTQLADSHKIMYYAPTTTEGATTVGINLSVSTDGVVSAGVSWSYSIADVKVYDRSNEGTHLFSIWHDVNEGRPVGSSSYYVEPGKLVRVDCNADTKTGNYYGNDYYEVGFGKTVTSGIIIKKERFEVKTFSANVGVICKANPKTLTTYYNGADYPCYDVDPEPDYTVPEIREVSKGGYIELPEPNVGKTGKVFIGYSTNPYSTSPEYHVGDSIRMFDNKTIYMIWGNA